MEREINQYGNEIIHLNFYYVEGTQVFIHTQLFDTFKPDSIIHLEGTNLYQSVHYLKEKGTYLTEKNDFRVYKHNFNIGYENVEKNDYNTYLMKLYKKESWNSKDVKLFQELWDIKFGNALYCEILPEFCYILESHTKNC